MIHLLNNLYAGRLNGQGDVRFIKFNWNRPTPPVVSWLYDPQEIDYDVVIPASVWASVVSGVSKQGDAAGRFYEAQAFHMNLQPIVDPGASLQASALLLQDEHSGLSKALANAPHARQRVIEACQAIKQQNGLTRGA